MKPRTLVPLIFVVGVSGMPSRLQAQTVDQVATVPPNIVLANYDNVPVGPYGGLEGTAYVARVSDPSAAWFNPAGLSRQSSAQIAAAPASTSGPRSRHRHSPTAAGRSGSCQISSASPRTCAADSRRAPRS